MFRSALEALRRGISKTAASVGGGLRTVLKGRDLDEELIDRIESTLVSADMGVRVAREVVDEVRRAFRGGTAKRGSDAVAILKDRLKERLRGSDLSLARVASGPTVILVVGVNGSGKTTSVAKIARALKDEGRSVLLAAGDTFRAGAVAQLEVWAKRLDIDMVRGSPNADPASVVFDAAEAAIARKADVLLVDTAGRLHNQEGLMRQLSKIRAVLAKRIPGAPHETLLVLDATTGQSAIAQAKAFGEAAGITGVFLSKLDGTARGGSVVQIRDELGVPVKLVGVGETPEDVEPFDADRFVEALFESLDDLKE
ncbi:MAG: signal recognition particle-docking protein FtsY [Planctomycetes bacterium]|nr:signal recognition particle-docking protein FtsY [Planctomycetota bacterium]